MELCSSKYLSIKPLEQKCIMTNPEQCNELEDNFKFEYKDKIIYTFKFNKSKQQKSLKKIKAVHSFLDYSDGMISFKQSTTSDLYTHLFGFVYIKIDDIFSIFDHEYSIVILTRIKLMEKSELYINFISLSMTVTTTLVDNVNDPTPSHNQMFTNLYYDFVQEYNNDRYLYSRSIYYCDYKTDNTCKDFFVKKFLFKNKDNHEIQKDDPILNHYLLNGIISFNDFKMNVVYKFLNSSVDNSENFPDLDESKFKLTLQNIISCEHIQEKGVYNMKCNCKTGYFGVDCSHKSYFLKHDCKSLNMCGNYGTCSKENNKLCECISGWTGKYCTKVISIKTTSTVQEIKTTENSSPQIILSDKSTTKTAIISSTNLNPISKNEKISILPDKKSEVKFENNFQEKELKFISDLNDAQSSEMKIMLGVAIPTIFVIAIIGIGIFLFKRRIQIKLV